MSDATDKLNDPVERAALLAHYAAGRCTPEEAQAVEAALRQRPELAGELELLRNLRARIRETETETAAPGEFGWARLKRELNHESNRTQALRSPWAKFAAIAASALLVVQVLIWQDQRDDTYRTLGDEPAVGVIVQIKFQPEATQAQVQALLREVDAEIVAGPSAAELYRVRLTLSADDTAAVAAAMTRLQQRSDVVTYARRER